MKNTGQDKHTHTDKRHFVGTFTGKAQRCCAHPTSAKLTKPCCKEDKAQFQAFGHWENVSMGGNWQERKQVLNQPLISIIAPNIPVKAINRKTMSGQQEQVNYNNMLYREKQKTKNTLSNK